jgi:hypothetical protein
LPAENQIILLLTSVLWQQRMRKYFKCYKQEQIYNAEVLSEAVEKNFYRMHKIQGKIKNTV